jgi:hypothetical protein
MEGEGREEASGREGKGRGEVTPAEASFSKKEIV